MTLYCTLSGANSPCFSVNCVAHGSLCLKRPSKLFVSSEPMAPAAAPGLTGPQAYVGTKPGARLDPGDAYLNLGSCKRPRSESSSSLASSSVMEDSDDEGCCCDNVGCPWQWHDSSASNSKTGSTVGSTCSSNTSHPSFFHGPLLSVKEYRDLATGDIRFVFVLACVANGRSDFLLLDFK